MQSQDKLISKLGAEYYVPEEFLNSIPQFAKSIYKNKRIADVEKEKFWDDFLFRYMTDEEFKHETQGYKIVFIRKNYYGFCKDVSEIDEPGYDKYTFLIEENPREYYFLPIFQHDISVGNHSDNNLCKTELCIYFNNKELRERRLVDTGASFTTIPFANRWNYQTNNSYHIMSSARYGLKSQDLNSNIYEICALNMNTALENSEFDMVIWRNPLMVSINNLPPVYLKQMLVPKEGTNTNVIGTDVINYHTVIISSQGGIVNYKFLSSSFHNLEQPPIFTRKTEGLLSQLGFLSLHENDSLTLKLSFNLKTEEYIVSSKDYNASKDYKLVKYFPINFIFQENKIKVLFYNENECIKMKVMNPDISEKIYLREMIREIYDGEIENVDQLIVELNIIYSIEYLTIDSIEM